jgi:hypothetical protein
MKTETLGIVKFAVALLGLGLGGAYFVATKDLNGAMGIAGTFGTVAGLASAVGMAKPKPVPPQPEPQPQK